MIGLISMKLANEKLDTLVLALDNNFGVGKIERD
jgi:hypothetical protein